MHLTRPFAFVIFAALTVATSRSTHAAPIEPKEIDPEKELIVRNLAVVDSVEAQNAPDGGGFTIEALLAALSRDGTAKTALLDWLDAWDPIQSQPSRPPIIGPVRTKIIEAWKTRDGQAGVSDADWKVRFFNAPFRLLAITNRLDLQKRDLDGLPLNAGEGRFVFCVTDGNGNSDQARGMAATVIFEYEMPATTDAAVRQWARDWHALGQHATFDGAYKNSLLAITERFAGPRKAPHKTNGSALNQLRTNEIDLSGGDWKLREFRLDPATGRFFAATTKQTPDISYATDPARIAVLRDYLNTREADILSGQFTVPAELKGSPFLGRSAPVLRNNTSTAIWKPAGVTNPDARYLFALNTCNGCHGAEAQTLRFTHIAQRDRAKPGQTADPAALSNFLMNASPSDPEQNNKLHPELQEITARKKVLAEFASPVSSLIDAKSTDRPSPEIRALLKARASREH